MFKLRTGITTGACATAAAKAGAMMLLGGDEIPTVKINVKGGELFIDIETFTKRAETVETAVRKYAGDDPDVTDQILIVASVRKCENGIKVRGGNGVGVVTKKGLKVDVGKSAINPVPMEMILSEVDKVTKSFQYNGGLDIIINVPDGETIAKKTLNSRLGIIGGISIIGTTGIVNPMSKQALIDTIKMEIDVLIANGCSEILINPGNYGYYFAKDVLNVSVDNAVKCSNYIGKTLDYAYYMGVERILVVAHAGKLIKLAGGIMNTHSNVADCRMEIIAAHCAINGMSSLVIKEIMQCVTVDEAIEIIKQSDLEKLIWSSIGDKISYYLNHRVRNDVEIEFVMFTHEHGILVRR
ncbi:MAG: cobalt-precorrin-5B (C(1))-methyltransferase CbiD [Bacilli bacterium]